MKISNKIKATVAGVAAVVTMGVNALPVMAATAGYCPNGTALTAGQTLADCGDDAATGAPGADRNDLMKTVSDIINVVIGVIGLVAVVVIILGGVSYTTSAGDPGKVKKAKDTILYGIIGLVVAILAYAIVNFVIGSIIKA